MSTTPEERDELRAIADHLRADSARLRSTVRELAVTSAATRRRLVVLFLFGLIATAQLVAFHANRCGSGLGPVLSRIRVTAAEQVDNRPRLAAACDASFPLLAHTPGPWPSAWNLIGLGGYVVIMAAGVAVARRDPRVEIVERGIPDPADHPE